MRVTWGGLRVAAKKLQLCGSPMSSFPRAFVGSGSLALRRRRCLARLALVGRWSRAQPRCRSRILLACRLLNPGVSPGGVARAL